MFLVHVNQDILCDQIKHAGYIVLKLYLIELYQGYVLTLPIVETLLVVRETVPAS